MAVETDYLTTPLLWTGRRHPNPVNPAGFLRIDEKNWKFKPQGEELTNERVFPEIASECPDPDARV